MHRPPTDQCSNQEHSDIEQSPLPALVHYISQCWSVTGGVQHLKDSTLCLRCPLKVRQRTVGHCFSDWRLRVLSPHHDDAVILPFVEQAGSIWYVCGDFAYRSGWVANSDMVGWNRVSHHRACTDYTAFSDRGTRSVKRSQHVSIKSSLDIQNSQYHHVGADVAVLANSHRSS